MAGDWRPASTDITDASTLGRSLIVTASASAARAAISAKAADYAPTSGEVIAALGYTPENPSARGQANGYATLDVAGKLPATQLPLTVVEYQGTYNANTNTPTLVDGSGNAGDIYRVSVAGTRNFGSGNVTLRVGDYVIYNGSIWEKSATTDTVASVATLKGDVTASALKTALSLDVVNNTLDADKPVSTATQTALDGKQAVMTTTGVKTGTYTAAANEIIPCNAASGAFTVTLPAAPADRTRITVKKVDTTATAVTVACGGSDKFNTSAGVTTRLLRAASQAVTVQYNSALAVWYVISTDSPVTAETVGAGWYQAGYISGQYYLANSAQAASTSAALGFGTLRVSPWIVTATVPVVRLFAEHTVAGDAASVLRLGIYADDGTGKPGALIVDGGTLATGGTAAAAEVTISKTISPGLYWVGGVVQGSGTQPTIRTTSVSTIPSVIPLGTTLPVANTVASGWSVSGVTAALPDPFGTPSTTSVQPRVGFKVG